MGKRTTATRTISGQAIYVWTVLLLSGFGVVYVALEHGPWAAAGPRTLSLEEIPFDGEQAFEYLNDLCDLGPRPSGSVGMEAQRKLLVSHFEGLGGTVELESFKVRHPLDGSAVAMKNLIVHWHPRSKQRILLCAHYDTRPFPDRDPVNPNGTFVGANDDASGVALLMELGRHMPLLKGPLGVDFVLFDGEELVFDERGEYFHGSTHFAREYAANRPDFRYRWAVLLDMIGDADLRIYQEVNSISWRDTKPLVENIWATARRLGVREFNNRAGHEVRDDHLPLHDIANIPACDIIDFDYPHWHTEDDTADKCSALSLAKVGWVMHEWLKRAAR